MDQEIVNYISQAQKHGLTDFEIKKNLLNAGWEAPVVEEGFAFAKAAENQPAGNTNLSVSGQNPISSLINPFATKVSYNPRQLNTGLNLSEQNFTKQVVRINHLKDKVLWLVVAVAVVLGGTAFAYYNYVYITPAKVWASYLTTAKPKIYKANYSFAYNYIDASSTKPITVTLSGNLYNNSQDPKNLEQSNTVNLELASEAGNISGDFTYLFLTNIFYINIGQIPRLKTLAGINTDWVKLDLGTLEKYFDQGSSASSSQFTDLLLNNKDLQTKLQKIWSDNKALVLDPVLTKENLKNTAVYHLKFQVDGSKLTGAILDSINAIQNDPKFQGQKISDSDRAVIQSILAKLNVKGFDVWIGQRDYQLYQFHLALNSPSISDLANPQLADTIPGLDNSREASRDAQRLNDIRQLSSALELYRSDFGGYPEGQNGKPVNFPPKYLGAWPAAPEPADGTCTDYFNGYWYKTMGKPSSKQGVTVYPSYSLSFCLGKATGGYQAGIAVSTPQGITGNISCPATPELCVNSTPASSTDVSTMIENLPFSSQLTFDFSYSDFGKTETLQAPEQSTDLLNLLANLFQTISQQRASTSPGSTSSTGTASDEQRLSDIRALAGNLELYFLDQNTYPDKLEQLTPKYLTKVPIPPQTDLGACKVSDNTYFYKKINSQNFNLTFCLGGPADGYQAGMHSVAPTGIK